MRLSDFGEEALIERVVARYGLAKSGGRLVVGVGDDAAVLDTGDPGAYTLVTTDMLTERMDFRLDIITPYQLGWKSLAVNISDIAAMGGEPTWAFVSLGFRPDTEVEFVDEFYRGMTDCAARFGASIAGGDMNSVAGDYAISVTQLGSVEPSRLALRSTARPGDRILVTGFLGDSLGGLELLLAYGFDEANRISKPLVDAHLTPIPGVPEARAATGTGYVRAMMDLSDGLGADLPKLCRASQVGAVVYADRLTISDHLRDAAKILGKDPVRLAAGGGEDFELLMAVAPEHVETVIQAVEAATGTRATCVGEVVEGSAAEIVGPDGSRGPIEGGWEHFA